MTKPTITQKWVRNIKDTCWRSEMTLALPLRKYDIRRKHEFRNGPEIVRFPFEGVRVYKSDGRPKNRRVEWGRGEELELAVQDARLELRWERNNLADMPWYCNYELLVPLFQGGTARVILGGTRRGGDREPLNDDGTVDTPFRDHAHALWDSETLGGVKIFACYLERRSQIEAKK